MRPRHLWMGVALVLVLASAGWAAPQETTNGTVTNAQGNRLITYTGVLRDADGNPRAGAVGMTFTLYASQDASEPLWREGQTVAADAAGRYTVLLGSMAAGGLPPELFGDGKAQWLAAQVDGEVEQPRVLLVAVPYALKAADADTLGGQPVASFVLSENLAKAIEEKVTSITVSRQPLATASATAADGTVGPLGNETGSNTWYGQYAGLAGGGSSNSYFGYYAGTAATGNNNSFFGRNAGGQNTTGSNNTFLGNSSGNHNTTANDITAVGYLAGLGNTGSGNSFFGSNSGAANTTGTGSAFFGFESGKANTTGFQNTFMGYQAGAANTSYGGSTLIGYQAGTAATANYNTMVGSFAGTAITTGDVNVFVGRRSGESSTTAHDNSFLGAYSGQNNSEGSTNTFLGGYAGAVNTTGTGNVFVGYYSGITNATGNYNTLIGDHSNVPASASNAGAIGYRAQVTQSNSLVLGSINGVNGASADTNVGIGTTAPGSRLDVRGEIGSGDGTLKNVVSYAQYLGNPVGVFGTLSGHDLQVWANGGPKMAVTTGGSVGIGTIAPVSALDVRGAVTSGDGTLQNVISYAAPGGPLVGVFGTLSPNDLQVWANGSPQMAVTAAGNVGIGTTSPQYKLHVFGSIYATGSYLGSDRRLKRDVQDLRYGLSEVLRLRPVSFGWKDPALGSKTMGLIAQEAEPIVPELVARGKDADALLSLNYVGLVPVLIKAMQEQQAIIAQKGAEVAALKAGATAQQAEISALTSRLAALEEQLQQLLAQGRDNK